MAEIVAKISIQVPFSRPDTTVAAETEVILTEPSPVDGMVQSILIHFPDGCNALVEVVCYINQEQILPLTGYLALNNATPEFGVNRRVKKGDALRVKISNKDTVNEHTPSIIWNLKGVP